MIYVLSFLAYLAISDMSKMYLYGLKYSYPSDMSFWDKGMHVLFNPIEALMTLLLAKVGVLKCIRCS